MLKEDTFKAVVLTGISVSMVMPPYTGRNFVNLAHTLCFLLLSVWYTRPVLKRWLKEIRDS